MTEHQTKHRDHLGMSPVKQRWLLSMKLVLRKGKTYVLFWMSQWSETYIILPQQLCYRMKSNFSPDRLLRVRIVQYPSRLSKAWMEILNPTTIEKNLKTYEETVIDIWKPAMRKIDQIFLIILKGITMSKWIKKKKF